MVVYFFLSGFLEAQSWALPESRRKATLPELAENSYHLLSQYSLFMQKIELLTLLN